MKRTVSAILAAAALIVCPRPGRAAAAPQQPKKETQALPLRAADRRGALLRARGPGPSVTPERLQRAGSSAPADLEEEDLLEGAGANLVKYIVVDDYLARFCAGVLKGLKLNTRIYRVRSMWSGLSPAVK